MSEIVDCSAWSAATVPGDLRCDVLVIGSGCGGATAARVLAEAGRQVIVVEEGGDFVGPARLTQRDLAMYDQVYADRGGRSTSDRSIAVLSGRVLGGGGVINACDVVPIADETWTTWRNHHGVTAFSESEIQAATAQALMDLGANPISESQLNENNRILRRGAQGLGWRGQVMQHNRKDCQGLGSCLIGCPVGAKRNPRMVAIPAALAAGAQVYVRARAEEIRGTGQPDKTITLRSLDAQGYHAGPAFRIRARAVVLAAGPVGTVSVLRASGLGGPALGRFLSLQPQIPITAVMPQVVDAFSGIPQAFAVTEFERHDERLGLSGFRIEPIFGTPGIIGSLVSEPGELGKAMMSRMRHFAASLLLLPDESVGQIRFGWTGRRHIDYTFTEDYRARARQAIAAAARLYLQAGAERVVVPTVPALDLRKTADLQRIAGLPLAAASLPLISAHQQGGARMGPDAATSVCDLQGQVHGTRDIYVMDTSVFPTSASSHTMAPVITMSHLLAGRLAAHFPAR